MQKYLPLPELGNSLRDINRLDIGNIIYDWKSLGDNIMKNSEELPMGLAFQLAMNEKAMENFTNMTDEEKQQILNAARSTTSKNEMRNIVDELGRMS